MRIVPKRPHELARLVSLLLLGAVVVFFVSGLMPALLHLPDPRPGCDAPLGYRFGEVDPRFPLGERDFMSAVREAEAVWEIGIGRDILRHDPTAELIVTTEFDERQKMTYDTRELESRIAEYEKTAETLSGNYDTLKVRYERDTAVLERRVADFEGDLREYNRKVGRINMQGGATEEEYEELEDMQEDLEDEQDAIEKEVEQLNGVVAKLNALAGRINTETATVNERVASFRETYGEPQPFIQGLYDSEDPSITIFQFERREDLRLVLAHELGHALGIDGHVHDDPTAIMYGLMDGQDIMNPVLKIADLALYTDICPEQTLTRRETIAEYLIHTPWKDMRFPTLYLLLGDRVER